MKPNSMLSPAQCNILELGTLFRAALEQMTKIEIAYHEAGPERSAKIALSLVLDSLQVTNNLVRAGLSVEDRFQRRLSGDNSLREVLALTPVPTPLTLALYELKEVHSGRIAPLLRHDAKEKRLGIGSYNFLRRYIRAGAAAAVQALLETGLGEEEAATRVANALNKVGFNPRGSEKRYSAKTIMDWRKRRVTSKGDFNDQYEEWLLYFRETASRVEQSRQSGQSCTVEEHRSMILFRLGNLSQVFSYRV